MEFRYTNEMTHIVVGPREEELEVLGAIVQASFELARPNGASWEYFKAEQHLELEDVLELIAWTRQPSRVVCRMELVFGRRCETMLFRKGDRHFVLMNARYEAIRGDPLPMLEVARTIYFDVEPQLPRAENGLYSTMYAFCGRSLDLRLAPFGLRREFGESDWSFRRNVFPELCCRRKLPETAFEFLLGCPQAEWDDEDRCVPEAFEEQLVEGKVPVGAAVEFIRSLAGSPDPRIRHERRLRPVRRR